jgi:hypothetical protein
MGYTRSFKKLLPGFSVSVLHFTHLMLVMASISIVYFGQNAQ